MLDKLDSTIRFHRAALNLREQRQQILAANIANSDTPNYQARDIDFNAILKHKLSANPIEENLTLQVTSNRHIPIQNLTWSTHNILYRVPYQAAADGNTVEMDQERTAFIDNSILYQSSLTFLGEQFKNLQSVLQQG